MLDFLFDDTCDYIVTLNIYFSLYMTFIRLKYDLGYSTFHKFVI